MGQIRELVLSWRAEGMVKSSWDDQGAVTSLLELLDEGDAATRVRALVVLGELLKNSRGAVRSQVMEVSERLVALLGEGDRRVAAKALDVLTVLLDGAHVSERMLLAMVDVAESMANSGDTFLYLSVLDLLREVRLPALSKRGEARIRALLSSKNPYIKIIGIRLSIGYGMPPETSGNVLAGILELMDSGRVILLETALDLLEEALETGLPDGAMPHLVGFLGALGDLGSGGQDIFLRSRALDVQSKVERILFEYYDGRRGDAVEVIEALIRSRRVKDAINLALILGGTPLLLRLWELEGGPGDTAVIDVLGPPAGDRRKEYMSAER
ncbi:hypothetical protein E3E36_06605 [Thermococcus sp. M36]|uniref:hypothetical protein n=1 Tax=Thermococcus sp. M36 TaxID=1638261 RepID=UPI0014395DE5|nr:hypothetical protein [Thermococcus sp. M36]NJE05818.1 hypothetical protein [Thermococcus sp. M36]